MRVEKKCLLSANIHNKKLLFISSDNLSEIIVTKFIFTYEYFIENCEVYSCLTDRESVL